MPIQPSETVTELPMKIKCPACAQILSIPDSAAGKVVKCPCGKQIKAPARAPANPQSPTAAGPGRGRTPVGRAAGSPGPRRPAAGANDFDPAMFDELTAQDLNPYASAVTKSGVKPAPAGNAAKLLHEHAATAGGHTASRFRRGPLASRGARFVAALLDGIFITIMVLPVVVACMIVLVPMLLPAFVDAEVLANFENLENLSEEEKVAAAAGVMLGFYFAYAISLVIAYVFPVLLYAIMVTKSGQTPGKKCMRIRILDSSSGELPGFVKGVLIRGWMIVLIYCIPVAGAIFAVVNTLMIFREGNRCLHDDIAGTIVVES